jgi:hypothetical protein
MSDFKDHSIINNTIYVTFGSTISIQNTWLIYIYLVWFIYSLEFSHLKYSKNLRDILCGDESIVIFCFYTSIFWRIFFSLWCVRAVLLTCFIFVFLLSLQLHYMAWRKIVMLKFQLGFHACHHQNMVYMSDEFSGVKKDLYLNGLLF